jgi:hypothetical protein
MGKLKLFYNRFPPVCQNSTNHPPILADMIGLSTLGRSLGTVLVLAILSSEIAITGCPAYRG